MTEKSVPQCQQFTVGILQDMEDFRRGEPVINGDGNSAGPIAGMEHFHVAELVGGDDSKAVTFADPQLLQGIGALGYPLHMFSPGKVAFCIDNGWPVAEKIYRAFQRGGHCDHSTSSHPLIKIFPI